MAEQGKSVEQDEDKRTTPIGLFNYAESYWKAATALKSTKLRTTHPDAPVSFLYYHAVELYLKSFLRFHGHSAKELRGVKYGHRIGPISKRASILGLFFMDEDVEVFSLMAATDAVIRSRYIQTGYFHVPAPEALDRTCKSLRESVGDELKRSGLPVRGIRARKRGH